MDDRQPDHRNHVGDDQDDVLRDLRPGDRLHAAKERAHQNAGQTDEHANGEFQSGKAAGDEADAVDLRHHIDEGHQHGGKHANQTRRMPAVARPEEVGNGELPELAQVGGEQQGDETVAAGPAHDEGQAVIAGQVERARHADEARGRHPVRSGGHAVEQGRDAAPGDVVFRDLRRLRHEADAGIQHDGGKEEDIAEDLVGHPEPLQNADEHDEGDEAAGIEAVIALQVGVELCLAGGGHYCSSPSWTPYSLSRLFMYLA